MTWFVSWLAPPWSCVNADATARCQTHAATEKEVQSLHKLSTSKNRKCMQNICKLQRPFRGDDGAHGMQTTSSQTTHVAKQKNLIATKVWTYEVFQGSVKSRMESCLGCKTSTGKHTNSSKQHQKSRQRKSAIDWKSEKHHSTAKNKKHSFKKCICSTPTFTHKNDFQIGNTFGAQVHVWFEKPSERYSIPLPQLWPAKLVFSFQCYLSCQAPHI